MGKEWFEKMLLEKSCFTGEMWHYSPAEAQFAKVDDLPPPALRGAGVVDAGGVQLGGAEGAGVGSARTQGHQQVPGGTKVPGELQMHRVGGGAVRRAAHVNLRGRE